MGYYTGWVCRPTEHPRKPFVLNVRDGWHPENKMVSQKKTNKNRRETVWHTLPEIQVFKRFRLDCVTPAAPSPSRKRGEIRHCWLPSRTPRKAPPFTSPCRLATHIGTSRRMWEFWIRSCGVASVNSFRVSFSPAYLFPLSYMLCTTLFFFVLFFSRDFFLHRLDGAGSLVSSR